VKKDITDMRGTIEYLRQLDGELLVAEGPAILFENLKGILVCAVWAIFLREEIASPSCLMLKKWFTKKEIAAALAQQGEYAKVLAKHGWG